MWDWVIWGALAVAVVGSACAGARLGIVSLRLLRDLKRSRRRFFKALDELAAAAEALGLRAEAAGQGGEEMVDSLARLAASRRRLAVLRAALDDVAETFAPLTAFYPRK